MSDSISNSPPDSKTVEHNPSNLRAEVDGLIAQGAFDLASGRLAELWRRDPASGTASFVTSRLDDLREKLREKLGDNLALTKFKLAILRSFTVEPIVPLLRSEAFAYGIDLAPEVAQQAAERVVRGYEQWIGAFRKHSQAALIVHSLERPSSPSLGILDDQSEAGQSGLIRQINRELRRITAGFHGMYALDYDALVARHGGQHWHDE